MVRQSSRRTGFTLIELMVVICVIAILVLITVFAFGSWRQRTATTEVKDALTHLATALQNEKTFNNAYPSGLPASYIPSSSVTIYYNSASPYTSYCASGTSTAVSSVKLYITNSNSTPSTTTCS